MGYGDGDVTQKVHCQIFRPKGKASDQSVHIVGSGYTGFLRLYPTLFAQALTQRNHTVLAVEFPGYGESTDSASNVGIAQQSRALEAIASHARDSLGFQKLV